MTGRGVAKGRARGRSRGSAPMQVRRPGEQSAASVSSEQQLVGRGRGRSAAGTPSAPPPQVQEQPPKQPTPPAEQLAAMKLNGDSKPKTEAAAAPATPQAQQQVVAGRGGRGVPLVEPHTRPQHIVDKRGTTGQEIKVVSNFVPLRNRPNCALYQYNVSYNPPIDNRRLRLALLYEEEKSIGKTRAFDGMILYLPHRLEQDVTVFTKKLRDESVVIVTITLTNELSANSPVCLQLFNVIFRRILSKLNMKQIGRHYYNPSIPKKIPQHKLELWPGFITSILQYEKDVMLCCDVSHKILRTDTVYDYLNDLSRTNQRRFHDVALKNLVGEIVLTRYNNKTYRIDDINWDMDPTSCFKLRNGEEISFVEYYKKNYQYEILDRAQPLLLSQPKERDVRARGGDDSPILLVPELCTRTGLSQEARSDFRVMKDVAVYTRINPMERAETLNKFIGQIESTECAAELDGWNLEFDRDLLKCSARILPAEKVYQRNASLSYKPTDADWSREMRGNTLISAVPLDNYMVVCTERDSDKAMDFTNTLKKVGPPMGLQVSDRPQICKLDNDRTENFLQAISSRAVPGKTKIVVVILPTNRKDRYDAIKKLCCVDRPIPSQCILAKTLSKANMLMSVTTKVALQINCKLGGELWALEIPLKKLMVIGVDTYHDSSRKGASVGGFIASMNSTLTKYYCQCMHQNPGQELADNLKGCMSKALRKYHEFNGSFPERIVVYRDGVGDGQLAAVVQHEVPQFTASFREQGGYNPKFAVVVVKKRINARIMAAKGRQLVNPPPGTVVDTCITKPEWYDFFLVSQSVRQGTVTPTHFNVIVDTSGLKPDHIQRLTYKLCHLYYNWPGTVRVPAPCQYAHKLAFLVGQSIHKDPHESLRNRLYFL